MNFLASNWILFLVVGVVLIFVTVVLQAISMKRIDNVSGGMIVMVAFTGFLSSVSFVLMLIGIAINLIDRAK